MVEVQLREYCRCLIAVPGAVKEARDLTSEVLASWDAHDRIEDARLVTSELVTNAIAAKERAEIRLRVSLHPTTIALSVWDSVPVAPELRHPTVDDENGRGLHIIDALALTRGSYPEDGGKVVFAVLRR